MRIIKYTKYAFPFLIGIIVLFFIDCAHKKPVVNKPADVLSIPKIQNKTQSSYHLENKSVQSPANEIRLTMNFHEAKLTDVLAVIAQEFEANLVIPQDSESKVTVYLYEVTLFEALDIILSSLNYSYIKKGQTIYILHNDKLVSQAFHLKFADVTLIQSALNGISESSSIAIDKSTNTIIVTDVADNIKTYNEIIEQLDIFQPSVMIETAIFEVSLNNLRNLGIEWGAEETHELFEFNIIPIF